MIVSTTNSIEGHRVVSYHGIVTGEAIMGANIVRDLFAAVRDVVGGRAGAYEQKLAEARETALDEMQAHASSRGANAVVGVDIDYEVLGSGNSMLMVSASGTAVSIEPTG